MNRLMKIRSWECSLAKRLLWSSETSVVISAITRSFQGISILMALSGFELSIFKKGSWSHMGHTGNVIIKDFMGQMCVPFENSAYFGDGACFNSNPVCNRVKCPISSTPHHTQQTDKAQCLISSCPELCWARSWPSREGVLNAGNDNYSLRLFP